MSRLRKSFDLRMRPGLRLNLALGVITLLTAAVVVEIVIGLGRRLLGEEQPWRAALRGLLGFDRTLLPLLLSTPLQIAVVLAAWAWWLASRLRQVHQLRLRRSEQKFRNMINQVGEAIFLLDSEGRILEWNKSAETLFDVPRRDVLNRPFRDIHLCYGVEIERAMADADRLGRLLTFEYPFPRRGQPVGLISLTISPSAAGADGGGATARAYVVIARDITSERQLETKMSETEKLAGIGQLAAGIAHQLNTPLGSILLSAQMLEESIKGEEDAEDVRRIIRQTEQCRSIIKGLLNFARPSGTERTRINLAEVVRETIHLLDKNIRLAGVEVVIEERGDAVVLGNRNELDQVFFNLLANALDAMPGGGRVTITLGDGAPGEIEAVFADTGEGIPLKYHDKVFLPFFTTKEYGKGTGLGLSIVARIVHEHGGRIEMQSKEGEGTLFHLAFPKPRLVPSEEGLRTG
jgi:PAS domain S-box-containing protein